MNPDAIGPRWLLFGVGILIVLGTIERWPKFGWPLLIILILGLMLSHPNALNEIEKTLGVKVA